jgi:hypothetical protein
LEAPAYLLFALTCNRRKIIKKVEKQISKLKYHKSLALLLEEHPPGCHKLHPVDIF